MKVNQLKFGSLLSYLQIALHIVIGIVYTPIMIGFLGKSEYGLYNMVASTVSSLTILNLGFNSGYILKFSQYKKKNDQKAIEKLNGMFLMIFSVIALVALVCGLFLSFNLKFVFDEGLTPGEYKIARVLMLLLTFNLTVSFPMSVITNIISANERFVFLKVVGALKTVFSPLLTLPLLLMGYGSIAMVLVTVFLSLVADVLYIYYAVFRLKTRFCFKGFEQGLFKSLFGFTFFIAINLIVDQINSNFDKIILGRYCGTQAVAVYSAGFTLFIYYKQLSTSISGVFTPKIHRIINATNDDRLLQRTKLTNFFIKVGRIQYILLSLVCSGLVFFASPFIKLWIGEGYGESYWVAVILALSSIIPLIQNVGIEIQRAMNKHKFRSLAYFLMAIINFVVSVILCQKFGVIGVTVGTAISFVLANGIIINIYYHKKCNIDIISFWKSIGRLSCGLVIPIIIGIIIMKFAVITNYLSLLVWVLIYCIVFVISMLLLGFNEYEKNLIISVVNKFIKKIK